MERPSEDCLDRAPDRAPPAERAGSPSAPLTRDQALALLQFEASLPAPSPQGKALAEQALRAHPELWRICGDLAADARDALIAKHTPQPVVQAAIRQGVACLEQELGADTAPALERLLIQQIAVCWLNVYDVQHRYSRVQVGGVTLAQGTYWEKRLSAAQRRYLLACESLARVRRLAQPRPLQINVAGQQLIVAGGAPVQALGDGLREALPPAEAVGTTGKPTAALAQVRP